LCFFFDEAHLLFDDTPKALLDKIEQVVRLIRSKGVGVYFITQNPIDVPETVAGQLNNRVQHKLNAFTPRDQKAVNAAAQTFRASPGVDVAAAITELKVGEALVSLLQPDGAPAPVARTLIKPPGSRLGPVTPKERRVLIETDAIGDKYDEPIDRESAEEILSAKTQAAAAGVAAARAEDDAARDAALQAKDQARADRDAARARAADERAQRAAAREAANSPWNKMATSAMRSASSSVGRQVGNEISKAVFGSSRRGSGGGGLLANVVRNVLGGLMRR
jgi:hypothetical protein